MARVSARLAGCQDLLQAPDMEQLMESAPKPYEALRGWSCCHEQLPGQEAEDQG